MEQENLENKKTTKKQSKVSKFFTVLFFVLIVFMASVLLTSLIMRAKGYFLVTVDGDSMERTIQDDDKLVALKNAKVDYGDIIIVRDVKSYDLIKRAIAFSGDTVEIKDGVVYLNGQLLDEPYALGTTYKETEVTIWQLEDGEVFYLGDNRENSADSRLYGVCTLNNVAGVVCEWSLTLRPFNNFIFGLFS